MDVYLDEVFNALTPILRKEIRNKRLTQAQRVQNIERLLEEKREDLMGVMLFGEDVIDYLKKAHRNVPNIKFPRRLTPAALKNSFLASKQNKDTRSVSDMSSETRRTARELRADPAKQHLLPWETYTPSDFAEAFGYPVQRHPLHGLVYKLETKS